MLQIEGNQYRSLSGVIYSFLLGVGKNRNVQFVPYSLLFSLCSTCFPPSSRISGISYVVIGGGDPNS